MPADISQTNITRLSIDDKDKLISRITTDEIGKSEKTLSTWKRKLVKYNELYKMVQNQRHYEGLARLFVPEILRAVETVVGNLEKIVFSSSPWCNFEALSESDEDAAQCLSELTRAQMEENNFHLRTLDSFRQMAISGLTVRKILWDFDQVSQKKKVARIEKSVDPITKKSKTKKIVETQDTLEIIHDNWVSEPVDLLGFHISDVTTPYHNIQKARWIGEQYLVDKQWVRDRIKRGWLYVENLEEIEETTSWNQSEAERYKASRKQSAGYTTTEYRKGIELIERWGLIEAKYVYKEDELTELELDKDDMVESVIVLANRKYFVKLEPNPFWHNQKPYVACPYVAQESEFSGLGVAAIGESLQEELNDTRNQVMDNKSLILMNMWLKERSSGIKNQDLKIRPLGVITTNNINGLKPLAPPVLSGVGVNIEGVIKEDLRQSTGASSNLQGIAQSGINTATESTAVNNASYGRLQLTAQQYSELVLKPTLRFSELLNYQYFDREKVIRLVGAIGIKYKVIAPDEIVGKKIATVKLSTDSDASPGVKRQQLLQFVQIVQPMPPDQIAYHWKLLDKVYKEFFPNAQSLADIYPVPPQDEDLLDPEEEFELMRQEVPTPVHQGDNDQEHIQQHEQDYEATKFAPSLSHASLKLQQKHLLDHYAQMTQKEQAQQMAMMQQAMGAPEAPKKPGAGANGQIRNASPFTQGQATKPSDLLRNLGGQ